MVSATVQARLDESGPGDILHKTTFLDYLAGLVRACTAGVGDVDSMSESGHNGAERPGAEDLLPEIYQDLRRLAAARLAREPAGQTLQPTALGHEAWLWLMRSERQAWTDRAHYFGAAAAAMRRVRIQTARRKSRLKRGGGQRAVDLEGVELAETAPEEKVLLIREALARLEKEDPEKAELVGLKFFAGLTNQEVAARLGVTERTVERRWAYAKAWLFAAILKAP